MLAHSNNVDIVINDNFEETKLLKGFKFCKVITKRQMPQMFKDILYQRDSMRPLASSKESAGFDEELDSEIIIIHA